MRPDASDPRAGENRRLLVRLGLCALMMFGFGFLLVPFYDRICEATGINNFLRPEAERGARAAANTQIDRGRSVTVQFDANLHDLPWRFRPLQRAVTVHPGELVHVEYEVSNIRDEPITGQAVFNVTPDQAGKYFNKIECFCFTEQTLKPGESVNMPVIFFVDPKIREDQDTKPIDEITLSYTFYPVETRATGR